MGQANCCCGSREALSEAEAVLSADVQLSRGRERSARRLLLLQEELVVAKLQGGTSLRPQLRLALEQLWVLSGRKEAAGEEEEEEQEGSGVDRSSLVFVWPSGSCIATFGSRALKELWLGTLLGAPEGAAKVRVTRLPSLQVLEKELRRRRAVSVSLAWALSPSERWSCSCRAAEARLLSSSPSFSLGQGRTFSARSLERLLEGQAKADRKQGLAPVPSGDAGARCRSAGEYWKARPAPATDRLSCAHLSLECRHAGAVARGRTSAGGARTPAGQRPLDVVLRGQGASAAAAAAAAAPGLGRARAGPGCPGGTPALGSLRASQSRGSGRWLPAPPAAPLSAALQGRAGQGRLRERWPGGLH
ncbi:uncharacterized protein LOC129205397 isoform X1 [Grus americana]|nr:uncharacterized protein LOC129204694 isoform X1 [Grus americana]XP_054677121.1 uncharacterized protein LOC129204705 isoform X1 [Grus americana]XP_054677191.1 uncharacterized protein LOC129204732 isoform X1 [Grus americana]XP_054678586.1 uncharacterized protein LOC129205314 isoform X1 [Grus americana]XP_054678612.1 uncharacterized protein LOC129205322 isoform X1 [Grus americana]XP_054678807.1 uncharacterized protein LOC129205387 isoform X1 [Grus americana]XP_054678835.1 uncharacterized prot